MRQLVIPPKNRSDYLSFLSWKSRVNTIYRATRQHATNLAKFVSLYKIFLLIQKKASGGKQRTGDTFLAGLLGGYLVFGERTAVNEQVGAKAYVIYPFTNRPIRPRLCSMSFHES